jgi:DNA-directed RNA polymerase subunit RPC12/RpoP
MFFFIGGVAPRTVTLDRNARTCSNCGRLTLYLNRSDHYLSLFFIPLFPVKRGRPFLTCGSCGAVFDERGEPLFKPGYGGGRTCPHCGGRVGPDFVYCPYCGKSVVPEVKNN